MTPPDLDRVREAARRIAGIVHRTPVHTSQTLDRDLGARVFFKCENLQKVGAFKARGATNAVFALDEHRAAAGVVTHSSGNHAAALAWAARRRGIACTVVMPEGVSPIKLAAVRGYGATVVICPRAEREATCRRLAESSGASIVPPYDHPDVIAGQGTAALELLEECPDLDLIVAPVGGGGLLAGTAIVGNAACVEVWGAEPEAVDDAYRSLTSGVRQPGVTDPQTAADGLLTGLGALNFEILSAAGVRIITVGEEAMLSAARFFIERMKLVVEPSGATVLAALRREQSILGGRRVGAILSGGNTDFSWLSR